MASRRLIAAILLLVTGLALLANPLYVHSHAERGGHVAFEAREVSLSDGLVRAAGSVRTVERLPPVERSLVERALDDGPVTVERADAPLWTRYLATEWTYVGSQATGEFYEPTVTVGENSTTVDLEAVPTGEVLDRVDVQLSEDARANGPRTVAVVGQQSDQVVLVSPFTQPARSALETAVEEGSVTVENGNDETAFGRLGDDWSFVVHDGEFYRVDVAGAEEPMALALELVSVETVTGEVEGAIVPIEDLAPENRRAVAEAIEIGETYVAHGDEVDAGELVGLNGLLVQVDGRYYELQFYPDYGGWDLSGPIRLLLTTLGVVCTIVGFWVGGRVWADSRES